MANELSQAEANFLRKMEKICSETSKFEYPDQGGKISVPLFSVDKKEEFVLDVSRFGIDLSKNTFQNRARKTVVLLRLDLSGAPHRNPDGTEVLAPHLHIYKEGYGDKFAYPLPLEFADCTTVAEYLEKFMDYCHISKKPKIEIGLFV